MSERRRTRAAEARRQMQEQSQTQAQAQAQAEPVRITEKSWTVSFFYESAVESVETAWMREGSFFVENTGSRPLSAVLEVSADGDVWAQNGMQNVAAGGACALTPAAYGEYCRVRLFSDGPGSAEVRFAAQMLEAGAGAGR